MMRNKKNLLSNKSGNDAQQKKFDKQQIT